MFLFVVLFLFVRCACYVRFVCELFVLCSCLAVALAVVCELFVLCVCVVEALRFGFALRLGLFVGWLVLVCWFVCGLVGWLAVAGGAYYFCGLGSAISCTRMEQKYWRCGMATCLAMQVRSLFVLWLQFTDVSKHAVEFAALHQLKRGSTARGSWTSANHKITSLTIQTFVCPPIVLGSRLCIRFALFICFVRLFVVCLSVCLFVCSFCCLICYYSFVCLI